MNKTNETTKKWRHNDSAVAGFPEETFPSTFTNNISGAIESKIFNVE